MRLATVIVLCSLFLGVSGDGWYSFFKEAVQGTWDLWRAYRDNLEANYQNADQYFYARGNYEAQQRGSGGIWAAKIIRRTALLLLATKSPCSPVSTSVALRSPSGVLG
ncbi:serum amyloid A-4 protein isoform X2 [Mus caroli]|uniref:Serum amyloid A protein n=1 Tax=Mus caroli TaxID=10089 RepID=A0A6P7R668_MUSCR|nr:serum amyloid A-4 protein isoform X2 [Mus caroli]